MHSTWPMTGFCSASRKAPKEQSARIIYDDKGKAAGQKVAPASPPAKGKAKKDY